jgi:hypothetical protein
MKYTKFKREIVFLVFFILILISFSSFIVNSEIKHEYGISQKSSLIGYWDFDEGQGSIVYDESGNENDGYIFGATWTDGILSNALNFDGVDDYVEVSDSPSLNFGTNDFSISAWLKTDYLDMDDSQIIEKMNRFGSSPYKGFYLRIAYYPSHHYTFEAGISDGLTDFELYSTSVLNDNRWHMVTAVFDRDNDLEIYVDGQLENSIDISVIGNINVLNSMYIGQQDNYDNNFHEIIDEIKLFNQLLNEEDVIDFFKEPFESYIIIGALSNLASHGDFALSFNSDNIFVFNLSDFSFSRYFLSEKIIVLNEYSGIIGPNLAFGIFQSFF